MKKNVILILLFVFITLSVSAQGFYFDIGLGLGKAWTEIDGYDIAAELKSFGVNIDEMAIDLGLKAGYGPFGNVPIYVIGEFGGIGHRIYDKDNYIQFNSYIIGPGIIFYPIPLIQLGFSIGYSWASNQTDIPRFNMYSGTNGSAWNISAAVDLGSKNHGCLLGIKYFSANSTLYISNAKENSSMVSFFVKYAYRKKAPSLF